MPCCFQRLTIGKRSQESCRKSLYTDLSLVFPSHTKLRKTELIDKPLLTATINPLDKPQQPPQCILGQIPAPFSFLRKFNICLTNNRFSAKIQKKPSTLIFAPKKCVISAEESVDSRRVTSARSPKREEQNSSLFCYLQRRGKI